MTVRGVLLGLLGAAFICATTYFNDYVIQQSGLIGSNMPVSVYGGLVIFVLLINPLFRRYAFSGRELVVALTITLAACCVPASGLMCTFTPTLMMPHHWARVEPGWRAEKIVEEAPDRVLTDIEGREDEALNGFIRGLGDGKGLPDFSCIPWGVWAKPLKLWLPLVLTLWIGVIGLSLVTHRQWSKHEHLPYPLATFTDALLPAEGEARGSVFHNRLFWLGLAVVLVIHMNNYACVWFPRRFIKIPLIYSLGKMRLLFPTFVKGGGSFTVKIFFAVVAFAYFLAADVSFSLGIGTYLWPVVVGVFAGYGVSIAGGGHWGLEPRIFLNFGAYLGALMVLIYTGRHYYGRTFREALLLPVRERVGRAPVWGARVFILCALVFATGLTHIGLDWQLAVIYTLLTFTLYLVIGRILAETGMFFMQPYWYPGIILWGLLGERALGPRTLLIMMIATAVFSIDPRAALMPFMVNSFKLLEKRGMKMVMPAVLCVLAVIVGLAVAVPVTLGFQYDVGVGHIADYAHRTVPKLPFNEAVRIKHRLKAQGNLELANSLSGWRRFAEVAPKKPCAIAFGLGVVLFLLCSVARLRWRWWPIHPVMFLIWNRWSAQQFAGAFLIGWFIKVVVTKYGGPRVYQKLKPLMFGLIAGEVLACIITILTGTAYYFCTGRPPMRFMVLPG